MANLEKIKSLQEEVEMMRADLKKYYIYFKEDGTIDQEELIYLTSMNKLIQRVEKKIKSYRTDSTTSAQESNGSSTDVKEDNSSQSTVRQGKVTASRLNVRKGPSTDFDKVDKLSNGETVNILEKKDGWFRIGTDKWVSGDYINEKATHANENSKDELPVRTGGNSGGDTKDPIVHDDLPKEDPSNVGYTRPEPISELNGVKANLKGLSAHVGEKLKAPNNKKADVLAVQYYLNKLGYTCPQDGKMDNRMGRQIVWFSKRCKLANPDVKPSRTVKKDGLIWDFLTSKYPLPSVDEVSDGYYDLEISEENLKPATQLTKDIGGKTPKFSTAHSKNLNKNKAEIKAAQILLNKWGGYGIKEDGTWGVDESISTADFQGQMGLEQTGIMDLAETWQYLTGKKKAEKKIYDTAAGNNYGPKPGWIKYAEKEIGVKEVADDGDVNNPRILEYHAATGGYSTDEPAWCASFACWCLTKAGVSNPMDPGVIKFSGFGKNLGVGTKGRPFYGCIGIINTSSKWGHVGFIVGMDKSSVFMLGGNQDNSVRISKYKISSVTAYLQPPGYNPPAAAWNLQPIDDEKITSGGTTR